MRPLVHLSPSELPGDLRRLQHPQAWNVEEGSLDADFTCPRRVYAGPDCRRYVLTVGLRVSRLVGRSDFSWLPPELPRTIVARSPTAMTSSFAESLSS